MKEGFLLEFTETLKTRKSTRSYKPEQITEEELNKVLVAGCTAPLGMAKPFNQHMTVIQNVDLMNKIADETAKAFSRPGMNPFYGAPTVVIISSTELKAPSIEYANVGCIIENMTLAATDIGLASIYLWGFVTVIRSNPELLKALNLPEGFTPLSAIALGYSTEPLNADKELTQTYSINYIK